MLLCKPVFNLQYPLQGKSAPDWSLCSQNRLWLCLKGTGQARGQLPTADTWRDNSTCLIWKTTEKIILSAGRPLQSLTFPALWLVQRPGAVSMTCATIKAPLCLCVSCSSHSCWGSSAFCHHEGWTPKLSLVVLMFRFQNSSGPPPDPHFLTSCNRQKSYNEKTQSCNLHLASPRGFLYLLMVLSGLAWCALCYIHCIILLISGGKTGIGKCCT